MDGKKKFLKIVVIGIFILITLVWFYFSSHHIHITSYFMALFRGESIQSCAGSNYTRGFVVEFSENVSQGEARRILYDHNVQNISLPSVSPHGYSFELPDGQLCSGIRKMFPYRDAYQISGVYLDLQNQPATTIKEDIRSTWDVATRETKSTCDDMYKSYFLNQSGYTEHPTNKFTITINGSKTDQEERNVLQEAGAYNITKYGSKASYGVTFPPGIECESARELSETPGVISVGNVPYMPTIY